MRRVSFLIIKYFKTSSMSISVEIYVQLKFKNQARSYKPGNVIILDLFEQLSNEQPCANPSTNRFILHKEI